MNGVHILNFCSRCPVPVLFVFCFVLLFSVCFVVLFCFCFVLLCLCCSRAARLPGAPTPMPLLLWLPLVSNVVPCSRRSGFSKHGNFICVSYPRFHTQCMKPWVWNLGVWNIGYETWGMKPWGMKPCGMKRLQVLDIYNGRASNDKVSYPPTQRFHTPLRGGMKPRGFIGYETKSFIGYETFAASRLRYTQFFDT